MREGVHELNKDRYLNGEFRDLYEDQVQKISIPDASWLLGTLLQKVGPCKIKKKQCKRKKINIVRSSYFTIFTGKQVFKQTLTSVIVILFIDCLLLISFHTVHTF